MINIREKQISCASEFSGYAQQALLKLYGDPRERGWGNMWLTTWRIQNDFSWFPASIMHIHKTFQPRIYNAFRQLERLDIYTEIKTFNEAFGIRFINGSSSILSLHSWGAAIDLNAEYNPLGSDGSWSPGFINVMLQNGIYCGQNWHGRKDPMHFAMING